MEWIEVPVSYVTLTITDIAEYVRETGVWDLKCKVCKSPLGVGDRADNGFPLSDMWNQCAKCTDEDRLLKEQEIEDRIKAVAEDLERLSRLRKDRLQCKHISTIAILEFLANNEGKWCTWFGGFPNSIQNAIGTGFPDRLVLAKMSKLVRKGLVSGCGCGCRGDFEITLKGLARLDYGND